MIWALLARDWGLRTDGKFESRVIFKILGTNPIYLTNNMLWLLQEFSIVNFQKSSQSSLGANSANAEISFKKNFQTWTANIPMLYFVMRPQLNTYAKNIYI